MFLLGRVSQQLSLTQKVKRVSHARRSCVPLQFDNTCTAMLIQVVCQIELYQAASGIIYYNTNIL